MYNNLTDNLLAIYQIIQYLFFYIDIKINYNK